ncbi:MAG TPA: twitching motility protein PilT [Lachnospiraceae bacterium]|nr:twitching motility protein PilT [uncultured Lachnoclostridium sp.]HAU86380.1 twitching motility protein PilT [Lachnospiraceae bacterium]
MVQIIAGETGKGKTKELIRMVNDEVRTIGGRIVYLDKTNKHMYELSNKIRLVNVKDYMTLSSEEFLGFLSGIISQDSDIEKIYIDSFLKVACVDISKLQGILEKIDERSRMLKVDFVLSISLEKEQLPLDYQKAVVLSL